jgi:hypothetical protein
VTKRREIALGEHVGSGPVKERRLAVAVGLLERLHRLARRELARLRDRALQPLAGAGDFEIDRAEARLAQAREEARVVVGEGARLAARLAAHGQHADHEIALAPGARALFEHARHLAFELAHALERAQPARFAREQRRRLLVGGGLDQAER